LARNHGWQHGLDGEGPGKTRIVDVPPDDRQKVNEPRSQVAKLLAEIGQGYL
jgi:hypothetical protein